MSLWDNKDAEPWDKNAPPDLHPVVKHLRDLFDHAHFYLGWTSRNLCYAQIHNTLQESKHKEWIEAVDPLKACISPAARQRFDECLAEGTLPAIFTAFFDFYLEGLV